MTKDIRTGAIKPATLKDVAAMAGVSVNAVSRALRDMPDIGAETKARVRAAADALGYRKNSAAAHLKAKRSGQIGVIISDIANPFFGQLVKGIERECTQQGYDTMIASSGINRDTEERCIRRFAECGVDGILLAPCARNEKDCRRILDEMARCRLPAIFLAAHYPEKVASSYVISDDYLGGRMAAQYLYGLGHRRFGLLFSDHGISSHNERLEGFRDYLTDQGLSLDDAIRMCDWPEGTTDPTPAALDLLKPPLDYTAMFCFCDYYAAAAYQAIYRAGLRIPEDISVIGYDATIIADCVWPKLTTIDITADAIGEVAAAELLHTLASSQDPLSMRRSVVLKPHLIVRDSACAPK